jgi:hypothetical protein
MVGASPRVAAIGETLLRLDCSDGESLELAVDAETLASLTDSVQAMLDHPAGLTCTLVQIPQPVVTFGSAALAGKPRGGYVIGAGSVVAQCSDYGAGSATFIGYFAVKMYKTENDGAGGNGYLSVPEGQCVGPSKLASRVTCLAIVPVTIGGGKAWADSFVTSTSGAHFAEYRSTTIGWGFEDNGPKGSPTKDRFRVLGRDSLCPVPVDPDQFFMELRTGNITIRP